MKMRNLNASVFLASFVLILVHQDNASAALIGNSSLNEQIGAYYDKFFPEVMAQTPVTTSSVPFQTTVSADDASGGSIIGSSSISDNGSVASIEITCSGSLTTNYNEVGENTLLKIYDFQPFAAVNVCGYNHDDGADEFISIAKQWYPCKH